MEEFKVEKDWTTKAGLRAVVLIMPWGCRNGYVAIDKDHILYGKPYSDHVEELKGKYQEVMTGPIGKRGVLTILAAALRSDEDTKFSPELIFNVHGGLTYSNFGEKYPVNSPELFWYGFDCHHAGDACNYELMDEHHKAIYQKYHFGGYGEIRTLEYVVEECENLAEQLMEIQKELSNAA